MDPPVTIVETLPVAFAGTNVAELPEYKLDPMIYAGSMFLIEPATTWTAGIPENGSTVTNLAADKLEARGFDPTLTWYVDAAFSGSAGKLERTTKGGIHGINSKTVPVANGIGAGVEFPAWFAQYILDNPTHEFAWSAWTNLTRTYGGSGTQVVTQMSAGAATNLGLDDVPYMGYLSSAVLGNNRLKKSAVPNVAGMTAADFSANKRQAFAFGRRAGFNNSIASLGSYIVYRLAVEDLTVSGRSFATFDAQDLAEHTKAFGSGGRYYADTYTDPATIA